MNSINYLGEPFPHVERTFPHVNERLHQLRELTPDLDAHHVPPILQIDANWFTQLQATDEVRPDRRGRRRTTSYLERLNRRFRRRIRAANAYHSDDGALAMIAQEADQAFRPGRTRLHKPAT